MKRIIAGILLVIVTCFSCEYENKNENGPVSNISGSNSSGNSSNTGDYDYDYDNTTSDDKITAANAASVISGLSSGTHTVKVTGAIDENTIYRIRGALDNTSAKVNLDLGETTGLTSIGYQAFYGCGNLVGIVIPDSVTKIGSEAFYQCYNLSSVTIGSGVTSIGSYAFYLSSLTSAIFKDTTTWYYEPGGYFSEQKIDVTNTTVAANYLKDIMGASDWYKK
ncbi:MAG: leucine-rich repeat domain-containing protein [Spirochaetales bacterium]|nr:leucine-rich repeat domain-containing protein [Spirochaetales bacterium]